MGKWVLVLVASVCVASAFAADPKEESTKPVPNDSPMKKWQEERKNIQLRPGPEQPIARPTPPVQTPQTTLPDGFVEKKNCNTLEKQIEFFEKAKKLGVPVDQCTGQVREPISKAFDRVKEPADAGN